MERVPVSNILERAKLFMDAVQANDPAPVPLEMTTEGPYVQMELTLGLYDVKEPDASLLKTDGTPGILLADLMDKEDPSPLPVIEELVRKESN